MPTQGKSDLMDEWDDDTMALAWLKSRRFILNQFTRTHTAPRGYTPTEKDLRAIDYLVECWDYGGLTR